METDLDGQTISTIDKEEELKSLQRVMDAFSDYQGAAEEDLLRWERAFSRLKPHQQALLPHLPAKYHSLRMCVAANARFFSSMLQAFEPPFLSDEGACAHGPHHECAPREAGPANQALPADIMVADCDDLRHAERGKYIPDMNVKDDGLERSASGHSNGIDMCQSDPGRDRKRGWASVCASAAEAPVKSQHHQHQFQQQQQPVQENMNALPSRRRPPRSFGLPSLPEEDELEQDEEQQPQAVHSLDGHPQQLQHDAGTGGAVVSATTANGKTAERDASPSHIAPHPPYFSGERPAAGSGEDHHQLQHQRQHADERNALPGVEYLPHRAGGASSRRRRVPSADVDKVRCVLRNIVRDWAAEGAIERQQCYGPILAELTRLYPMHKRLGVEASQQPTCLVPGAGLGRLALEISRLGFLCQGNEFSYYMLVCSSFLLNYLQTENEWTFFPWLHTSCNVVSDMDQLRPVHFPDLSPWKAGITEGFSMCAGDFLDVYNHPSQAGRWDCIVTSFFIDTAHNVVDYIETIHRALKPEGHWINLGPLLYHFADAHSYSPEDSMSLEISLEDVKSIAFKFGFTLVRERQIETTYTANLKSMMRNTYTCAFWTMIKGKAEALV
eukprot:jgi/Mesen1/7309/ME000374S06667